MCYRVATVCEQARLEQEATQDCALRYLEAELAWPPAEKVAFLVLVVPQRIAPDLVRVRGRVSSGPSNEPAPGQC